MAGVVYRDSVRRGFIDHKQVGVRLGSGLCAAGLLSLLYPKFVSRGETSPRGGMCQWVSKEIVFVIRNMEVN